MTQKRKVLIVTLVLIFFSGLIVTYKNHQVSSEYRLQLDKQKEQDVAYWAAEVLMEKVKILEASVATLDKSTVQILKRMDVRYFAYAYKAKDQWKIKWKVIGDTVKKQIVKEVNSIPFGELSSQKRNWFNEQKKMALVSPVEMADSEQLKNGFLIFGLNKDFFSGVLKVDPKFEIFTFSGKQAKALIPSKKLDWLIESGLMDRDKSSQAMSLDHQGVGYTAASYFSSDIQLWLVRLQETTMKPFVASSAFRYFLMAMVLCFGLVLVLFSQLVNFSESLSAKKMRDTESEGFKLWTGKVKKKFSALTESFSRKPEAQDDVTQDLGWMEGVDLSSNPDDIHDFSEWMEALLAGYRKRVVKNGIQLHTNIPSSLSVRLHTEPTKEFIRRLVENSIQVLMLEDDKSITIDIIEKGNDLTLSYTDSRTRNLPTIKDPTYLLEVENPLEDINGIMSYGRWLFADKVHSATNELSIYLELEKVDRVLSKEDLGSVALDRIVIEDDDEISLDQFEFKQVTPAQVDAIETTMEEKSQDYVSQSIDDIISSFEMNSMDFDEDKTELSVTPDPDDVELKKSITAEKEVVQFEAGEFKLKIRAPKKRDDNVNY